MNPYYGMESKFISLPFDAAINIFYEFILQI